jgi:hypothetical protein
MPGVKSRKLNGMAGCKTTYVNVGELAADINPGARQG